VNSMPLVRSIEELTPKALTDLLRARGVLDSEQSVTAAESTSFGEEGGLLSFLYRVALSYSDGATGPGTVVVKLPTDDPNQRGIADALGFFNRECVFYGQLAESAPFRCPTMYGQAQADDSTDFVLVMEDLGHMSRIDQVVGATRTEAEAAMAGLAKFHAHYWDHHDLDELSATFLPLDNPIYHAALPDVFGAGWAALKANEPGLINARVEEFGDNYGAHLANMLAGINTPRTLVHGDYRADNLMLDQAGNLAVIDFQIMAVGSPAFDVAYFISQSVTTETRRELGEELLSLYHETLRGAGVDYSMEEFTASFQTALSFCLIYGVASFAAWESFGDRQKDLMRAMASRTVATIIDADSLATLPAL